MRWRQIPHAISPARRPRIAPFPTPTRRARAWSHADIAQPAHAVAHPRGAAAGRLPVVAAMGVRLCHRVHPLLPDGARKSAVLGKSVLVRVVICGLGSLKKKKKA